MNLPVELGIASHNPGKIREIRAICAGWPVRWVTADEDPREWPDVEETGATYLENALLKGHEVARALGIPVVADDSGIEVDALGGAPGPRSARYAGEAATDEQNLQALITAVRGVPRNGRTARYRCVAAMCWPDGRERHAEATVEGILITKPRGEGGFGYDPIFVPEGWDETMAELPPEQKDRISHRGRAFRALADLVRAA
ncbi:MAG: RdgB/HAM1 family non-canonical purine NTP pyrophosphatase [Actinomycetota bacterium]